MLKKLTGLALLALSLSIAACGDPENPPPPTENKDGSVSQTDGGNTCDNPCGTACCTEGQSCFGGACCTPSCDGKTCGDDGCGGECGTCGTDQECSAAGQCVAKCIPETNDAFCERLQKDCGSVTALDNCEKERTWNCGTCSGGEGWSCVQNVCTCEAETDNEFCARMQKQCGPATGTDNCGEERTVEECGPCNIDAHETCSATGQCIACTATEDDATFCQNAGKNCGNYTGPDSCGAQRTAACGDCTGAGEVCTDNVCGVPGAPANDSCLTAEELLFTAGQAQALGDTTLATDSGKGGCNSSSSSSNAPDVAYTFTIDQADGPQNVDIVLDTPSWDAVIYMTEACPMTDPSTEVLDCKDTPEELHFKSLPPGTYYIWVDGWSTGKGAFTLDVTKSTPPPAPSNDTCTSAEGLNFNGTDTATAPGTTLGAINDGTGTCGTMNGGDVVYTFEILGSDNQSVTATVVPDSASTTYKPAVYIVSGDCATGTQVACGSTSTAGGTAAASALSVAPGTYYVIVDGVSTTDGNFSLSVQTGPEKVLPDDCATAEVLDLSSGSTSIAGDTSLATDSGKGSCDGSSSAAPDLVYSFTIDAADAPKNLDVVFDTPSFDAVVYLSNACPIAAAADTLQCKDYPEELHLKRLPAGTYYIWVDGYGSGKGAFTASVSLTNPPPPPGNDLCINATELTFTNDIVQTTGTTVAATNDSTGSCGTMDGADVAYYVDVPGPDPRMLTATVTRDAGSSSFNPAVYIRSTCDDASTQAGCGTNSSGTAVAKNLSAAPGRYYIVVDGMSGTEGAFSLEVKLEAPLNLPDDCATAEVLNLVPGTTLTVSGDTTLASNSSRGTCGSSTATAPDLVYSFTIDAADAPKSLDVVLDTPSWDAVIYLANACPITDAATQQLQCKDTPEELHLERLPAGTYYIWVDGYSSGKGAFTMDVLLTTPPPAPDNDLCSAPEPLVFNNGVATAQGDTTTATHESTGSCGTMDGKDVFYAFNLAADSSVSVIARPTSSTFKPALYIRSADCAGGTEVACSKTTIAGGVGILDVPTLPAGDYFLAVDGMSGTKGAFDLQVTTGTATTLPDDCTAAQQLDLSSGHVAITGDTTNATQSGNSSCATSTYQDLVYTFTTTAVTNFVAKIQYLSSSYGPNLYLRQTACDSTDPNDELVCGKLTTGGSLTISKPSLPAGTYWLWVDHPYSGEKGPFALEVSATEPLPNDSCALPEEITLALDTTSGVSTGQAIGDTRGAFNLSQGSCGGASKDLVYSFTTLTEQTVEISVVPDSGSALKPVVYLRSPTCDTSTDEVAASCSAAANAGDTVGTYIPRLPAGTYYLWVDGQTTTEGAFTVNVTTRDPPMAPVNDVCDGELLDLSSGTATLTGETYFATNDYSGNCAAADGADLVYQFSTAQDAKFTATVTPQAVSSKFEPVLYLRTICGSSAPTDEVTCAAGTAGAAKSIVVNTLPAGSYYLVVDGARSTFGRFDLQVSLEAPVAGPLNESCTAPEMLTVDMGATPPSVTVPGTTTNAQNEITGTCSASNAGDVVYSLTTLADHKITATVTPSGSFDPSVFIRTTCSSTVAADQLVCNDSNPSVAVVKNATAGTYYIWVDGDSASSPGDFSLQVTLEDPVLPPTNDTCANPTVLTLGTPVTGDTADATDDYGNVTFPGVCDGPLYSTQDGEDLIYSYTPAADGAFTITLTTSDPNFDSAIWVTEGTCGDPGVCAYAVDTGYGGDDETLTIQGVAGTTYFIVVDSFSRGEVGPFTLTVN